MRILVIEDELGIWGFLKQGLEEERYSVDVAEDGIKGLDIVLEGVYDLIFVDWMLPGISGVEVTRSFRKEYPETPVILWHLRLVNRFTFTCLILNPGILREKYF